MEHNRRCIKDIYVLRDPSNMDIVYVGTCCDSKDRGRNYERIYF
jgi:hypothetical protein